MILTYWTYGHWSCYFLRSTLPVDFTPTLLDLLKGSNRFFKNEVLLACYISYLWESFYLKYKWIAEFFLFIREWCRKIEIHSHRLHVHVKRYLMYGRLLYWEGQWVCPLLPKFTSFAVPSLYAGLGHIKALVNETWVKVMQTETWHVLAHWGLPSQNSPSWNSGTILSVSPSSPAGGRSSGEALTWRAGNSEHNWGLQAAVSSKAQRSERGLLGAPSSAYLDKCSLRGTRWTLYEAEKWTGIMNNNTFLFFKPVKFGMVCCIAIDRKHHVKCLIQTWGLGNFAFSHESITLKAKINLHSLHSIVCFSFPKSFEIFIKVQIWVLFHTISLSARSLICNEIICQNSNNSIIILICFRWNVLQMFALTAKSCH